MKKTLLVLFIVMIGLSSCRTTKSQSEPMVEWQTLSVPFKLNIERNISPSGKAYFERNKSVYLSVRFLGMEVISFFAEKDSVYLYDKTHGILLADKLGINPLTLKPMTINQFQDFLLGYGNYGSNLELCVKDLKVSIIPQEIISGNDITQVKVWKYSVRDIISNKGLQGNLTWNLDNAEYNAQKIPEWKYPGHPKQIMGIDDMYRIIISQF